MAIPALGQTGQIMAQTTGPVLSITAPGRAHIYAELDRPRSFRLLKFKRGVLLAKIQWLLIILKRHDIDDCTPYQAISRARCRQRCRRIRLVDRDRWRQFIDLGKHVVRAYTHTS